MGKLDHPDTFIMNQNWINSLKCYTVCFLLYDQVEFYQIRLKLRCWSFALSFFEAFSTNKKRSGTSLHPSFSSRCLKEIFFTLYSFNWPNFITWLLLHLEMLRNMCIVCQFERHKFWKQRYLFYQAVFLHYQKVKTKNLNTLRTKRAFYMKEKSFSIVFKGPSAPAVVSDPRVGL